MMLVIYRPISLSRLFLKLQGTWHPHTTELTTPPFAVSLVVRCML